MASTRRPSVATGNPPAKKDLDLQYMNTQLMRDPYALDVVWRRYGNSPLVGFLGIDTKDGGLSEMPVGRKDIAESIIRWRIIDDTCEPAYVTSNVQVPSTLTVGQNYSVELNESWLELDALLQTENPDWILILTGKDPNPSGPGTKYQFQVVGMDNTDTSFPARLLEPGKKLNYIGNAKGEKSASGQPLWDRNKGEDYFNTTTYMRHEFEASGHAMSTKQWTYLYDMMQASDGQMKKKLTGYFPFTFDVMNDHMDYVHEMLYYSRGNFDPAGRKIINQSGQGRHKDRPLFSGLREQMDSTRHVWHYDPINDSATKISKLIDHATTYQRNEMRIPPNQEVKWVLMTRNGGDMVVTNAWYDRIINTTGQQVQLQKGSDGKVESGFGVRGYRTVHNDTISVMNIDYQRKRGVYEESAQYDSIAYPKTSFDLYLVPVYTVPGMGGRKNISIYTKKHTMTDGTVINRGLVVGHIGGMTGMGNSAGLDAGARITQEVNAAYLSRFNVGSEVDADKFMVASEFSVAVYNPDDILKIEAQFKKTY